MQDNQNNKDEKYGYQVLSQHFPNLINTLQDEDPLLAKSLQGSLIRPHRLNGKSKLTSFLLCFTLGIFGAHRFYVGKNTSAVWMLLSLGGLGIWTLWDCISILTGSFEDGRGQQLY